MITLALNTPPERGKRIYHWYADCPAWPKPHDGMRRRARERAARHGETDLHERINCATCRSRED